MLIDASRLCHELTLEAGTAERVYRFAGEAEQYLRETKGEAWYEATASLPGGDPQRERAERAEAVLSLYYALPTLNLRYDPTGGLVGSYVQAADGSQQNYLRHGEVDRYRADLLSRARSLVGADHHATEGEDGALTCIGGLSEASGLVMSAVCDD